jgi:hypothetical protein
MSVLRVWTDSAGRPHWIRGRRQFAQGQIAADVVSQKKHPRFVWMLAASPCTFPSFVSNLWAQDGSTSSRLGGPASFATR